MRSIELAGIEGVRWIPDSPSGIAALVLAGSSGRVDSARAELLARHGVIAESIQWFGGPGQNEGPWDIPLELFLERVADLAQTADRVVVLGTSFGSEAALLTGAHSPHVSAVVAFAALRCGLGRGPTRRKPHLALDPRRPSHFRTWTFVDDWEPDTDPPAFVGLYEECRRRFPESCHRCRNPGARASTRCLLVAGGDDKVWPSLAMAEVIKARRHEHGLETTLVFDPDAGHRTVLPGEPRGLGRHAHATWRHRGRQISVSEPPRGATSRLCSNRPLMGCGLRR